MENGLLYFYRAHCERKLQDSVKFQLETFSLFFHSQLEPGCLFLMFGQSEPQHCSYKVVSLIKKHVLFYYSVFVEDFNFVFFIS